MIPVFGRILGEPIPAYFALLSLGFATATFLMARWAKRSGLDHEVVIDLGLVAVLAGVIGARILHVFADGFFWDYVHLCTDPSKVDIHLSQTECALPDYNGIWDAARGICVARERDCFAWAKFWNGGLTYYGGFIGASVTAYYLLRHDRFPFWKGADMAGLTIPIGLGFGRMGCLLAGCCFGKETGAHLGLVFPADSPASEWQSKHGLLA